MNAPLDYDFEYDPVHSVLHNPEYRQFVRDLNSRGVFPPPAEADRMFDKWKEAQS